MFGKTVEDKNMPIGSKLQNTPLNGTNIHSTLDNSVSLPPLDYNTVDDMKKTRANISFFKLAKAPSQWDILLRALGQSTIDSVASISKGACTPPELLSTMLNTLWMEETKSGCPPFLLSFVFFNYNVHNCLVDSSVVDNVMLFSIAQKINARWSETFVRIIQLEKTAVPTVGELWDMIIWLSHDSRVHQCINIVVVDMPEAYGLLLSSDWSSKLDGYFATDSSHMWLPYKGRCNEI